MSMQWFPGEGRSITKEAIHVRDATIGTVLASYGQTGGVFLTYTAVENLVGGVATTIKSSPNNASMWQYVETSATDWGFECIIPNNYYGTMSFTAHTAVAAGIIAEMAVGLNGLTPIGGTSNSAVGFDQRRFEMTFAGYFNAGDRVKPIGRVNIADTSFRLHLYEIRLEVDQVP